MMSLHGLIAGPNDDMSWAFGVDARADPARPSPISALRRIDPPLPLGRGRGSSAAAIRAHGSDVNVP
jgi:homoserine kinase